MRRRLALLLGTCVLLLAAPGAARSPADTFKGRIIMSTMPFPASFNSDRAFIRHMKKINTERFQFAGKEKVGVEFMAFFARTQRATEFTATIYDVTDRREMVANFPILPGQKKTRILASYTHLDQGTFQPERRYHFVISASYGGRVLAETNFQIKADPKVRAPAPVEPPPAAPTLVAPAVKLAP